MEWVNRNCIDRVNPGYKAQLEGGVRETDLPTNLAVGQAPSVLETRGNRGGVGG